MATINWKHCVGQQHVKENLEAAIANGTLGHAYLFSGMEGSGKFATALDLALILLCEDKNIRPCMKCGSCTKVLHYAHPDFHVVLPVDLPKQLKGKDDEEDGEKDTNDDEGVKKNEKEEKKWEFISERIKDRIKDVYVQPEYDKKPNIPVSWIRELAHAILRGKLGKSVNVGIFDGVDLMRASTGNAMLKLLEEPPAGTVLLLLTDRPSGVLPTIVSRCQILRFSYLPPDEISAHLCSRFSLDPSDTRLTDVIHTGSLGRSLYEWDHPAATVRNEAMVFWDLCTRGNSSHGNWQEIAEFIDRLCEDGDFSFYERLFMELMQLIRNAFLHELDSTDNLFSGDSSSAASRALAMEQCINLCERSIAAARAYGNMTLVLSHFALTVTGVFHGEKQQSR
jgi:hypothetical protein